MEDDVAMPSLHKVAPLLDERSSERDATERIHLLRRVEDVLRKVVGSEGRMWLFSSLAALSVPRTVQTTVFFDLVRRAISSSTSQSKRGANDGRQVARQVVRVLCESRPRQVARLLSNDSSMLCHFFSGNPGRVLKWFQCFDSTGETDHQLGARALARYAFVNRESSWHELVWKGNHSQAPATVASKPHYFAELNVLETINNFLENVPSFWYSEELRDSLEDGQYLSLDINFFGEELLERLDENDSSRVWQLVKTFLAEESFSVLCQRILPIASDITLLEFINGLGAASVKVENDQTIDSERRLQGESKDLAKISDLILWLETVLSSGVEWETLQDVVFCNACACHARDLFRLLQGGQQEGSQLFNSFLSERNGYNEKEHWKLRRESLAAQKWEAIKWLCVEAWILFYLLSQEKDPQGALEKLMIEDGICFFRTGDISKEEELGRKRKPMTAKDKRKSRKRRSNKREGRSQMKQRHVENSDFESDSDWPIIAEEMNSDTACSWRLSIDKYLMTWAKVDVIEHLVTHALSSWLQWTVHRW